MKKTKNKKEISLMCVLGEFAPEDVLPYVVDPSVRYKFMKEKIKSTDPKFKSEGCRVYAGQQVKMFSWRYQTFKTSGLRCCVCGIEGKIFRLEQRKGDRRFHFNLYAFDEKGFPVLMTKDHVIPKSKGGKDSLDNFQTMCSKCNFKKADTETSQ